MTYRDRLKLLPATPQHGGGEQNSIQRTTKKVYSQQNDMTSLQPE